MELKIGLMLDLPDDKAPGFYAQMIKALAGKAQLFDRDKEMLVVSDEDEQQAVLNVMAHYKVEVEPIQLMLLPDEAELTDLFSDYGFISRSDHPYLYEKLVFAFRLVPMGSKAEIGQAKLQLEEHLLAEYNDQGNSVYIVDRQLEETMHGIAKAYHCQIEQLV